MGMIMLIGLCIGACAYIAIAVSTSENKHDKRDANSKRFDAMNSWGMSMDNLMDY
jgi:hypothetical protein